MPPRAKQDDAPQLSDATADAVPATAVTPGDDFELVYVCNPELHKGVSPAPSPGRVTRAWLDMNGDKGWVESDASGNPVKG
jgi:hypothetical protein